MTATVQTATEFIRRPGAARFLAISVPTLKRLERLGQGPKRVKIGRAVVYPVTALRDFMAAREQ